jgi:hypothetical protein
LKNTFYCGIVSLVAALFVTCGNSPQIAGNSSQSTGVVAGKLVQSDGTTPAAHVNVTMRLRSSLPGIPLFKSQADSATMTTDTNGNFRFDTTMIDPGLYVLEAASLVLGVGMVDSVVLRADDRTDVKDTLKAPGAIRGRIILSEGGDLRKTFVAIFGLGRIVGTDSTGVFFLPQLGEGAYTLRLISMLDMYGVVDRAGVVVTSGDTTELDAITIPFSGVAAPKNLTASLNVAGQSVVLRWVQSSAIDGYRVYRNHADSGYVRIGPNLVKDTYYVDTGARPSTRYKYQVMAVDAKNSESVASAAIVVNTDSLLLWQSSIIHDFGALGMQDVRVWDLDGDLDNDIVATTPDGGNGVSIVWLENNQGVFTRRTIADSLPGFVHAYAPTVTYINNDGILDIVAVLDDKKSHWLYWFKNDGAQHFTPIKIDSLAGFCSEITITMMGTLTRSSIVLTVSAAKGCVWYEYDNDTTFTRHFAPTKISFNAMAVADFDRDGDNDFYIHDYYEAQAYWYENRGDTTFAEHLMDNAIPMSDGAQATDFDSDGDIDVIARSAIGLFLYRNDGRGNFTESALVNTLDIGAPFFAADLLGAGRLDLVVSQGDGIGNTAVGWYQNTLQGFNEHSVSHGDPANLLGVADFNGDGRLDILARTQPAGKLFVYYQQ